MPKNIDRDELKAALDAGDVTIVDTLGGFYFETQHLPGALPLVAAEVAERAEALLPDRDAMIATYCSDPGCPNSGIVAKLLEKAGYTNVHRYEAGIADWVAGGLPTETGAFAATS